MIGQDIGPFLLEGNDIGCLLIHSFTNPPHEMRGMGNYLAQRGLAVLVGGSSGLVLGLSGYTTELTTQSPAVAYHTGGDTRL